MKNIKKSVSEVGEAVDSSKPKKGQKWTCWNQSALPNYWS
jgi:hypothetical protein